MIAERRAARGIALGLLAITFACATSAIQNAPALRAASRYIVVDNNHWMDVNVGVMCGQGLRAKFHQVGFGQREVKNVHLGGCSKVHFEIDFIGSSERFITDALPVPPEGQALVLTIENRPEMTHLYWRAL